MSGAVKGDVALILRAEGAVVLAAAAFAYQHLGGGWGLFALLFLAPDLGMLGYLAGPRLGAASYNACHTYVMPALLALIGWWQAVPLMIDVALIWIAHIGFDRMVGYGLKYPNAFGATHLGWKGKPQDS